MISILLVLRYEITNIKYMSDSPITNPILISHEIFTKTGAGIRHYSMSEFS